MTTRTNKKTLEESLADKFSELRQLNVITAYDVEEKKITLDLDRLALMGFCLTVQIYSAYVDYALIEFTKLDDLPMLQNFILYYGNVVPYNTLNSYLMYDAREFLSF